MYFFYDYISVGKNIYEIKKGGDITSTEVMIASEC